ncbi:complement C1q-like protein 2 [Ruditapes philippinarum]|uniref:complement C1q-like protein 2 n=1 Tax=Ruditapes philippinarum TaxID=129788 RepID=UPI00295BA17A|nr:complement C1q-like protein 2 [Ruditapes philippinarum]
MALFVLFLVASATARSMEHLSAENQIAGEYVAPDSNHQFKTDISDIETETAEDDETGLSHWFGNNKIAFSTYLSRRYNHLGKGQHVKFDKVLLNDGDGYEASTGVFRAKVSGVYMFTYAIAQRNKNEIRVNLMYDGKIINGAVAEGRHTYHDAQGTNTAIIHVCKDKAVWIEAVTCGPLEGNSADRRFTTFSGFLLYARR